MRLPQSSTRSLSVFYLSIAALVLAAISPVFARQVTPQLTSSPANIRFGSVAVGQSEIEDIVLTNTGETSATISAISVSGSEFSVSGANLPLTLGAGQSATFSVIFQPSTEGGVIARITITSNAENPTLDVGTQGTGVKTGALTANPSSVSFGNVAVGSSATSSVMLSNPNSGKVTISALQPVGSGFSVKGPSLPVTLLSGQSITLSVSFAPQAAGTDAGSVFVTGPSLNIPLTGTGTTVGQLTISPGSLNFGNVDVGSSTTEPSSMMAAGGSVTVSSASSSNTQFSITGVSFPLTIPAGQSVAFDVVFAPTQTGADSSTLTFASNASSAGSEALSGTGIEPTYSVTLTWNPSTPPIAGYNVYRGTAPGSYSKINSTVDPNTTYTDSTVVSGATYYYAATSVNSSGQESEYSKPVQVLIP
jgi:hypothetical protein